MVALKPERSSALSPAAARALADLARCPPLAEMYLAGSAALALYLGHRAVDGLDWMAAGNRLLPADRRDLLRELLAVDPATLVETARDGYLFVRNGAGVAIKFFHYPYPLVDSEREVDGLLVASALDLALMKLGAIISRGTRRDFVDFYLLSRHLPLADVLDRAGDKYGHVRDFPLQALKGLADFSQVAGEPMPRLATDLDWDAVRAALEEEVRAVAGARFGIATAGTAE